MTRWIWHGDKHCVACTPSAVVMVQRVPDCFVDELWRRIDTAVDRDDMKRIVDTVCGANLSAGVALWNGESFDCAVRGTITCQDQWAITGEPRPRQQLSAPNVTAWFDGVIASSRLTMGERGDANERAYKNRLGRTDLVAGWGHATVVMSESPEPLPDADEVADRTIVGIDWEDDMTIAETPVMPVSAPLVCPSTDSSAGVASLRCPNGHDNPPTVKNCCVCDTDMSDATHITIAQPTLGHLRLPSGRIVEIHDDIIFGRMPQGTNRDGRPAPLLVPVDSPRSLISRTHCEVRVDGWKATVIDHHSNNGTFLLRAGQQPQQVMPGTPMPLKAGDSIDLGDGVHIDVGDLI